MKFSWEELAVIVTEHGSIEETIEALEKSMEVTA